MPGLVLSLTIDPDPHVRITLQRVMADMLHGPDYTAHLDLCEGGLAAGHVAWPGYPFRQLSIGAHTILLEGHIYNKTPERVARELQQLAPILMEDPVDAPGLVRRWVLASEGEYVVCVLAPERREALLFSDFMCRLPVYYYFDSSQLLVAREAKFVQALKPNPRFDRLAFAEALCLSLPLGDRTFYEDVRRAPGGLLLRSRAESSELKTEVGSAFVFDFDDKDTPGRPLEEYARGVVDRLVVSCSSMGAAAQTDKVLSLSGGQDSRALAAAFVRARIPIEAATRIAPLMMHPREAQLAQRTARMLGIRWHPFSIEAATQQDVDDLVWMKDGTNYSLMAQQLGFLRRVLAKWGRKALFITGDGGNTLFSDLRPALRRPTLDSLVRWLLRASYHLTTTGVAEQTMGLPLGTIEAELRHVLERFPERCIANKAVHFDAYQKCGQQWAFDGEDRNRFYLWSTAPLFSVELFRYTMRIPDGLKKGYRLYRSMQMQLSPAASRIPDARWKLPIASPLFGLAMNVGSRILGMPAWVKRPVRLLVKGRELPFHVPETAMDCIRERLLKAPSQEDLFSPQGLEAYTDQSGLHSFSYLWTLLTLEKLWERREGPPSAGA